MIIRKAELETVCGITSTLPENLLPEFAFMQVLQPAHLPCSSCREWLSPL